MSALLFLRRHWPVAAAIGAVMIIAGLIWSLTRTTEHAQDQAVKQAARVGAAEQRAQVATESLNRTEKANAAAHEVRVDPVARRDGCLRHSRTPENC